MRIASLALSAAAGGADPLVRGGPPGPPPRLAIESLLAGQKSRRGRRPRTRGSAPHWLGNCAACLLLFLLVAACSRTKQPAHGALVVLRFENLSGDAALDWMGRGAARQIASQLDGATVADAASPSSERERFIASGATRILHGYLSRFNDRLRLRADLEDPTSGKFIQSGESSGPASEGLLPLAGAVARQLDSHARPAATKSEAALAAYIAGLTAPNAAATVEALTRAIAADPDFGAAYLALIEFSQSHQDRASAERFLAQARARGDAIPPVDRARLDVVAAQISGDSAALSQSLVALARLTPADGNLLRALAGNELQARRYNSAVDYYKKALAAQPGDADLLNTLGYTQAYAGDLEGAMKTLRDYERLRPTDANPLDSLGDVNFFLGRFPEAEKFYRQEYGKDPGFLNGGSLIKAATARLLTGDAPGAEAIFAEYEGARRAANDPLIELNRAAWDYLRGKRSEAIHNLESFAGATKVRDLASLAHSSLTVWLLEAGDRGRARQQAQQATATAASQPTAALAAACRFVAEPAPELGKASFPDPLVRAYTLLLAKNFSAAVPLLREILAHSGPSPAEITPVLLAWALEETGKFGEVEEYLRGTPVPAVSGPAPFEALAFPRIFYLRAVAAEKKGLHQVAEQNYSLFKTLTPK